MTKYQKGFTLIEIIVAIFGFAIIMLGVTALVSLILTSYKQQSGLVSSIDQARKVAGQLTYEIRDAQTASTGAYPIDSASEQQLIFYSNADKDSSTERIRYYVNNGALWKGVTGFNGTSYDTTKEQTNKVVDNLANGSSPVFLYYDDTYIASSTQSSLIQPVNLNSVKFIKVILKIYNKAGVNNDNYFTVSSSAALRNLKTNLGQ